MSIASEITRLSNAKGAIKTAIEGKGVTVPSETKIDGYAALIGGIVAGGGLPAGIAALDTGTFTPSSNVTSWVADHSMGVMPDFFYVFDTTDLTQSSNAVEGGVIMHAGINKEMLKYPSSGEKMYGRTIGGNYGTGAISTPAQDLTTTSVRDAVFKSTSCKYTDYVSYTMFLAGHTYRWIVGTFS